MKKIDFIIVGAQKTGTTTFYDWIKQHPSIYLPETKEMPYFARNDCFNKKEQYLKIHYPADEQRPLWGAAHVNNMFFSYVAERIHSYNPQTKIIAILRNPTNRAYSSFW